MWFRKKRVKSLLPLLLIFILASITRFYGISWGGSFYFHPDENNMAWAISRLSLKNLNPHFFAYGQFPLYLTYITGVFLNLLKKGILIWKVDFSSAVFLLRFFSALFSLATILIGFKMAEFLFKDKISAFLYALFLTFSPGLIQAAHFGTTESILIFVFLTLSYLSLTLFGKRITWRIVIALSLLAGIGLATKISSLFFVVPISLLWLHLFYKERETKKALVYVFLVGFFFFLFSPFYFLAPKEALSSLRYEAQVASGSLPVFYTRQFLNTIPVLFQLQKIFPWVMGIPAYSLFLFSLIFLFFLLLKREIKTQREGIILSFLALCWFLPNTFLFVKWTRFMIPVLPFFYLLIVWEDRKTREEVDGRFLRVILDFYLFLCLIPGIFFMKIYLRPDIRLTFSKWLNENLPAGSIILSESGNVVDLPLFNKKGFEVINFNFYQLDNSYKEEDLYHLVQKSNYILLPSRRVFANHLRVPHKFPKTARFYRQLFSGKLGFYLVEEFKIFNGWEEVFLGSDLASEETWTVFDHPTIRLFARKD